MLFIHVYYFCKIFTKNVRFIRRYDNVKNNHHEYNRLVLADTRCLTLYFLGMQKRINLLLFQSLKGVYVNRSEKL